MGPVSLSLIFKPKGLELADEPAFGGLAGGVRGGGVGGDRYVRVEYPILRYLSVNLDPFTYGIKSQVNILEIHVRFE